MKIDLDTLVFLLLSQEETLYYKFATGTTTYLIISAKPDPDPDDPDFCTYSFKENKVLGLIGKWKEVVDEFLQLGMPIEDFLKEIVQQKIAFALPW